jgi:hypothetical protein
VTENHNNSLKKWQVSHFFHLQYFPPKVVILQPVFISIPGGNVVKLEIKARLCFCPHLGADDNFPFGVKAINNKISLSL